MPNARANCTVDDVGAFDGNCTTSKQVIPFDKQVSSSDSKSCHLFPSACALVVCRFARQMRRPQSCSVSCRLPRRRSADGWSRPHRQAVLSLQDGQPRSQLRPLTLRLRVLHRLSSTPHLHPTLATPRGLLVATEIGQIHSPVLPRTQSLRSAAPQPPLRRSLARSHLLLPRLVGPPFSRALRGRSPRSPPSSMRKFKAGTRAPCRMRAS